MSPITMTSRQPCVRPTLGMIVLLSGVRTPSWMWFPRMSPPSGFAPVATTTTSSLSSRPRSPRNASGGPSAQSPTSKNASSQSEGSRAELGQSPKAASAAALQRCSPFGLLQPSALASSHAVPMPAARTAALRSPTSPAHIHGSGRHRMSAARSDGSQSANPSPKLPRLQRRLKMAWAHKSSRAR